MSATQRKWSILGETATVRRARAPRARCARARWRWLLRLALPAVIGVGVLIAETAPALADSGWTVRTPGGSLNLRSGPGTSYPIVGSLPNGTTVHVYCTDWGTSISGNSYWDYLGGGKFATDSLIETGTNGMGAPWCSTYHTSHMEIDPTGTCGSGTGGDAGVNIVPPADWYEYVPYTGCFPHDPRYYWTGGNGPQSSGDYFQWLYYAGAYASCDIHAYIPPNGLLSQDVFFDENAFYGIWTARGVIDPLAVRYVNQNTDADSSGLVDLGTYQTDGSGLIAVILADSSLYKYGPGSLVRVVAASMVFDCTQQNA